MRFARREYGTRALIELAAHYGRPPLGVRTIAQRQAIPEKYLEQIMAPLKRARLVTSVRGAQGGYRLARPPGGITLADIHEVLGGPPPFHGSEDRAVANLAGRASPTLEVYRRIQEMIVKELGSVTLADLVRRQREIRDEEAFAYTI